MERPSANDEATRVADVYPTHCLFPDTNVLLHYQRLDQVDWCALVGRKLVTLLISPVVVRELDEQKYKQTSRRLKKRAAELIGYLSGLVSDSTLGVIVIREGVHLVLQSESPGTRKSISENSDDQIVMSILAFREANPGTTVQVVTADLGLQLKATQNGLPILRMPDRLKLEDSPDPLEVELNQTRQKLAKYERAAPNPTMAFENGETHMSATRSVARRYTEQQRVEAVAKYRERYPKMISAPPRSLYRVMDIPPSQDEVDKYDLALERFFEAIPAYLDKLEIHSEIVSRTISIKLIVQNTGTAPAEDLDVSLEFPAEAKITDREHFVAPGPPALPKKPQSRAFAFENWAVPNLPLPPLHAEAPNVSEPEIVKNVVYCNIRRLKHNQDESLPELMVTFPDSAAMRSFKIEYTMHVGNVPDEITDVLHVAVDRAGD